MIQRSDGFLTGGGIVRRLVLTAGAAALLTGCGSNAQTARNPQPPDTTPAAVRMHRVAVGDVVTLTGTDDAGRRDRLRLKVKVGRVLQTVRGRDVYDTPRKGERFAAVRFVVKNVGTSPYVDSPTYGAQAVDDDGATYDPTVARVTAGPGFARVVRLGRGQVRAGYIVFAVPRRARIVGVRYALNAGQAPDHAEWRVS